jgi:hypothetical protein
MKKPKLSQTKYAIQKRKERREETPEAKKLRLAHRRKLMKAWRAWYASTHGRTS